MIDDYTLLQVVGQGNYGLVYRAKNIKNNQQYAVKIVSSDKLHQNSKLQQCTMNQVQTLTTIGQTDHIIMYYQMLKTKNNYYFVYEFCNGGTLMQMMAKQRHLGEQVALDIFRQLLEAFKVLNKLNIMHRDLKPENIFFTDNKVKLGDFGFCKGLRPEQNLTKTMLGSPIYMAPQVLRGQAYSTKADIWSLGVILYEMLYAVCPFQSSSIAMLISTINSHEILLPAKIKVSQKTQQLLKKLLTKDYFRRIGWIELFNWFGEEQGSQKGSASQSTNYNCPTFGKTASLVEEWASKNRMSELNVKERSISQDFATRDTYKFDMASLQNVPSSNFRQVASHLTPSIGQYNRDGQNNYSPHKDNHCSTQNKTYSGIRQSFGNNLFQSHCKPTSLPKHQSPTRQQIPYGNNSCYKPQSSGKKVFYSQNYQDIFSTPVTQKDKKNGRSIQVLKEDLQREKSDIDSSNLNKTYNTANQNNGSQRMSLGNNQLINSRTSNSVTKSKASGFATNSRTNSSAIGKQGSSNINQLKLQDSRNKRKQILQLHQQCLNTLKYIYGKLQQEKYKYIKIAFFVLSEVLEKLKEITKLTTIAEIDLLDITSLLNYQIIQVDRMVVDIREQIQNNSETVPTKIRQVQQVFQSNQSGQCKVIKNCIQGLLSTLQYVSQHTNRINMNDSTQNISQKIMFPKARQEQKQKYDSSSTYNQGSINTNKHVKSQYYTTNQFSQYYKNLVQSKVKNTTSNVQCGHELFY